MISTTPAPASPGGTASLYADADTRRSRLRRTAIPALDLLFLAVLAYQENRSFLPLLFWGILWLGAIRSPRPDHWGRRVLYLRLGWVGSGLFWQFILLIPQLAPGKSPADTWGLRLALWILLAWGAVSKAGQQVFPPLRNPWFPCAGVLAGFIVLRFFFPALTLACLPSPQVEVWYPISESHMDEEGRYAPESPPTDTRPIPNGAYLRNGRRMFTGQDGYYSRTDLWLLRWEAILRGIVPHRIILRVPFSPTSEDDYLFACGVGEMYSDCRFAMTIDHQGNRRVFSQMFESRWRHGFPLCWGPFVEGEEWPTRPPENRAPQTGT